MKKNDNIFLYQNITNASKNDQSNVSFIPYFQFLVFRIWSLQLGDFLSIFFRLAHLALQNVNKDYVMLLYFLNFVTKFDKKQKNKKWNETDTSPVCMAVFAFQVPALVA